MGAGLTKEEIKSIQANTTYTDAEITRIYKDFTAAKQLDGNKKTMSYDEFKAFFSVRFQGYDDPSMKKMFNCFDTDKNGSLDFKEFSGALSLMTRADPKVKMAFLFDMYDADKSGTIDFHEYDDAEITRIYKDFTAAKQLDGNKKTMSYDEFKVFFKTRFEDFEESSMKSMFNCFDTDKNGSLDFKEFSGALSLMTRADPKVKMAFLFDMYDADNSGTIDQGEISTSLSCDHPAQHLRVL
eukprot:gene4277-4992_t